MDAYTGTRPPADSHRFDAQSLANYLKNHLPGFEVAPQVEQFKGGQSNPTYKLSCANGQRWVMRTKPGPVAKLLPSAHAIEREFQVMQALASTPVPVARMGHLCADESIIGRAFYLMEFVDGRVLWDPTLPGMTTAERAAHYDEMNRVIAALHAVRPAEIGLSEFGKPGNYFERQIGRWSKQYLASVTGPNPAMDELLRWLPQNIPAGARAAGEDSVIHGDFRMDNLIFHPTEARVVAVLDWELSTLGHPLADFSYHCMSWHIPPGTFRGMGGVNLDELGIPQERAYLETYCQRTGRQDVESVLKDWNFYLAYNLFRIAAIVQGIAKRVEDGTASSAQARATGAAAPALAQLGWQFAQRV